MREVTPRGCFIGGEVVTLNGHNYVEKGFCTIALKGTFPYSYFLGIHFHCSSFAPCGSFDSSYLDPLGYELLLGGGFKQFLLSSRKLGK